jgi:hypothetical protein
VGIDAIRDVMARTGGLAQERNELVRS